MTECPNCGKKAQAGEMECSHCGTDFAYVKEKLSIKEAEVAEQKKKIESMDARLFELIEKMTEDQLGLLLESAEELFGTKRRVHGRYPCLITADCVYQSRASNLFVKNISLSGVFIETSESFSEGEEVSLVLAFGHRSKPFRISGEIVRSISEGIGVKFKIKSQIQEELIQNILKELEQIKK
jgi:Tfp pilus assembly protein PilZ/uncharacterized Zn finger protein (UPF0148 family)